MANSKWLIFWVVLAWKFWIYPINNQYVHYVISVMILIVLWFKFLFVCLFQGWDEGTRAYPGSPRSLPDGRVCICRDPQIREFPLHHWKRCFRNPDNIQVSILSIPFILMNLNTKQRHPCSLFDTRIHVLEGVLVRIARTFVTSTMNEGLFELVSHIEPLILSLP